MSTQCDRLPQCDKQQQEYEYVMEGITTRMQIALEKQSASLRWVCIVMLITVLLVIAGFIIDTQLWINHVDHVRSSVASEVSACEAVSQLGPRT